MLYPGYKTRPTPALKHEVRIQRQILDYMTENPGAEDTFRGVVEWWLLKQQIAHSTAEVKEALSELTAAGKLSAWTGPDGQVHYSLPGKVAKRRSGNN
jgi:hypothetical protein